MSSEQPEPLQSKSDLIDSRKFCFGEIWMIKDALLSIPDADRLDKRNLHDKRAIVIISNNNQNYNKMFFLVTIAPLSSRIDCSRTHDVPLFKERDQVKNDCLLRLPLSQPILKVDLDRCVGVISDDAKDEIIDTLLDIFGGNLEEN